MMKHKRLIDMIALDHEITKPQLFRIESLISNYFEALENENERLIKEIEAAYRTATSISNMGLINDA